MNPARARRFRRAYREHLAEWKPREWTDGELLAVQKIRAGDADDGAAGPVDWRRVAGFTGACPRQCCALARCARTTGYRRRRCAVLGGGWVGCRRRRWMLTMDEDERPREEQSPRCTEAEWRAFYKIGQIREIASPGFADRVALAHEEGLLGPMLEGDQAAVQRRASQCIAALSAQIRYMCPAMDRVVPVHAVGDVPEWMR